MDVTPSLMTTFLTVFLQLVHAAIVTAPVPLIVSVSPE